ncbi:MAG: transglutaminase-like cysteine peptidase [Pseudomonadales bacterium]|nr:transglutaminase-like cysteine peptidase [Pseudomonadales bacterium]
MDLSTRKTDANRPRQRLFSVAVLLGIVLINFAIAQGLGITEQMLDTIATEYGRKARARVVEWNNLVDQHSNDSELEKLQLVNQFFNRNRFVSDIEHWKKPDYWATPIEFLSTKGGDCEDFAIAKYLTLRALGIPDEKLRITYVKAILLNQAHMVLTYYKSKRSVPLVLDNLNRTIKPATQRTDLKPVYSFNGIGLWAAKMRDEGQKMGSADDLNMWRDLSARLQREKSTK